MERLIDVKEVARILGISETTAKIWASQRKFPVVKVGRLIRISPQALEDWISRNTEAKSYELSSKMKFQKKRSSAGSKIFESFVEKIKNEK